MKTTTLAIAAAMAAGTLALAQDAVQWRVEDGGNGHWYSWFQDEPTQALWTDSDSPPQIPAFKLVVIDSEAEQLFLTGHLDSYPDYTRFWIGYYRVIGQTWDWRSGASSQFTGWGGSDCGAGPYPNYGWSGFLVAALHRRPDCGWNWDDYAPEITPGEYLLLEYSADCNGDGIVDYGQILDGTFEDANENGVPDCCDTGTPCDCLGDVNNDGQVNGADISVLLGFWGLNGKPVAADINKDGSVDGADLAAMLGRWGECP